MFARFSYRGRLRTLHTALRLQLPNYFSAQKKRIFSSLGDPQFEHGFRWNPDPLARFRILELNPVHALPLLFLGNLLQHCVQAVPSTRSRPEILSVRLDRVSVRSIRSHRGQGSRISRINLSAFLHCTAEHQLLEFVISAQSQNFLASGCSISSSEIVMHNLEELFELV